MENYIHFLDTYFDRLQLNMSNILCAISFEDTTKLEHKYIRQILKYFYFWRA